MTAKPKPSLPSPFACSFCGRCEPEVTLIQGPAVQICDGCVCDCVRILVVDLRRRRVARPAGKTRRAGKARK
jgi:ATP-dependent protease Clp ATPase subunit